MRRRRAGFLAIALAATSLAAAPARARREPAPPTLEAPTPAPEAPPADAPPIAPAAPPLPLEVPGPTPSAIGEVPVEEVLLLLPPPRPRMTVAIGMGVSFEQAGLPRQEVVPAFFATGGVGADWRVGAELAVFASSAQGRFAQGAPVDRLALAAVAVARPFAWSLAVDDPRYVARLLRATGLEVGPALERDSTTVLAGSRWGLQLGARIEVPIGPGSANEWRVRLAARRMLGFYTPRVGTTDVGDGVELYSALVTVF